jgi:hypothetical protein
VFDSTPLRDMDKLRLLLLCQLRFPHIDLNPLADRILGVLALDALTGQHILRCDRPIPILESDPEVLYVN